jgi:16S rRNA pseudouridine516 synthase
MSKLRLDRVLSNLGYATRSEVRALLRTGRVTIDGRRARDPSEKVAAASVRLDGEPLDSPDGLFVVLHKPVGYVCSHDDRDGSRVWELLPARWLDRNPKPTTVGRLDKDSSGLLLVTDLHPLVHDLTSPRRHVPKRYEVGLDRPVDDPSALRDTFASGALMLRGEDAPCLPAELTVLDDDRCEVVLVEGRHRQVRRMFAACGYQVESLHRTAVGPYRLDDLAPGAWRHEVPPPNE